jgi:hypothetical protein
MKMFHHYADDGRIMKPPSELHPLLKEAFPAFSKLLGHMRLFYMADEIWDGQAVLVCNTNGKPLSKITLADGAFRVHMASPVQNNFQKSRRSIFCYADFS